MMKIKFLLNLVFFTVLALVFKIDFNMFELISAAGILTLLMGMEEILEKNKNGNV